MFYMYVARLFFWACPPERLLIFSTLDTLCCMCPNQCGCLIQAQLYMYPHLTNCLLSILAGLIHANHEGKIIDYLLQQLKNATTDVRIDSVWCECCQQFSVLIGHTMYMYFKLHSRNLYLFILIGQMYIFCTV